MIGASAAEQGAQSEAIGWVDILPSSAHHLLFSPAYSAGGEPHEVDRIEQPTAVGVNGLSTSGARCHLQRQRILPYGASSYCRCQVLSALTSSPRPPPCPCARSPLPSSFNTEGTTPTSAPGLRGQERPAATRCSSERPRRRISSSLRSQLDEQGLPRRDLDGRGAIGRQRPSGPPLSC